MREKEKVFFGRRILLFMDILGSKGAINDGNADVVQIKELVTHFSKNTREADEIERTLPSHDCDLLFSSKEPKVDNLTEIVINSTAAYVRVDDQLFYIIKGINSCKRIEINKKLLEEFDLILKKDTFIIDNPKKLSSEELKQIKRITEHAHSVGVGILKVTYPVISSFSDHIVLSHPFAEKAFDLQGHILDLFQRASWFHHIALERGLLMRGAITIGDLWHEKNIIMGKALVDAVNIEEKISVYPRVVVMNEIISLLPEQFRGFLLATDHDGLAFINYMSDSRRNENITNIHTVIQKNLQNKKITANMNKYSKWCWLASKFGLRPSK